MDAVLLTWRWQNILSIWVMIVALVLISTLASQLMLRSKGKAAANAVG